MSSFSFTSVISFAYEAGLSVKARTGLPEGSKPSRKSRSPWAFFIESRNNVLQSIFFSAPFPSQTCQRCKPRWNGMSSSDLLQTVGCWGKTITRGYQIFHQAVYTWLAGSHFQNISSKASKVKLTCMRRHKSQELLCSFWPLYPVAILT